MILYEKPLYFLHSFYSSSNCFGFHARQICGVKNRNMLTVFLIHEARLILAIFFNVNPKYKLTHKW